MRRGDLVTTVLPRSYGNGRPALVVQADVFEATPTVVVVPLTTHRIAGVPLFRIPVEPSPANGLEQPSDIQIDKVTFVPREKASHRIGVLEEATLRRVDEALGPFLGLTVQILGDA